MSSSVTIQRRVQWMDTDAAGIWHHSVVLRWAEEAEAELHRELGIIDLTFGATPRVKTEFEFPTPVRFDDVVDITLAISSVGTTSMTYEIHVVNNSKTVAKGRIVVVFIDRESGQKLDWPAAVREAVSGSD
jgi:acyl-CoA thioester hydrolase